MRHLATLIAALSLSACVVAQPAPAAPAAQGQATAAAPGSAQATVINGIALTPEQAHQAGIPAGRYWYDPISGLWGYEGGPTQGVVQAGVQLGGALRDDASAGTSGVFLNERNLSEPELAWWQNFLGTGIQPGRYFLDHMGNMGMEGGPALVNIVQVAQSRGGGDNFWSRGGGINAVGNESGGAGYVCVEGSCATYGM